MIIAIISLAVICTALIAALVWSVRLNLIYLEKIEEVRNQIDESLDILDSQYQRAAAKAELEVLSDEPIVRELIEDIRSSRDAILLVANLIVEPLKDDEKDLLWHQKEEHKKLQKKKKK